MEPVLKDTFVAAGYQAVPIARLEVDTLEEDFSSFHALHRLFNPELYIVRSLERHAATWRCGTPFAHWEGLEEVTMIDCFPLRPEQGDMGEGIAVPYLCCTALRKVTTIVEKWDTLEDGILGTIFYDIPPRSEFRAIQRFEVHISGKRRYNALVKAYNDNPFLHKFATAWAKPPKKADDYGGE